MPKHFFLLQFVIALIVLGGAVMAVLYQSQEKCHRQPPEFDDQLDRKEDFLEHWDKLELREAGHTGPLTIPQHQIAGLEVPRTGLC